MPITFSTSQALEHFPRSTHASLYCVILGAFAFCLAPPNNHLNPANLMFQDKHAKNLSEKLAARLSRCETETQWNQTAYALSLLQHKNEEIAKTVQAGFRVVAAQG